MAINGWTDEVTVCDCCGKSDLSGTFSVTLDDAAELHYGSVCVRRHTKMTTKEINSAARANHKTNLEAACKLFRATDEYRAYRARFALRETLKMAPGRASADFVRDAADAESRMRKEIAAKFFGVLPFELF